MSTAKQEPNVGMQARLVAYAGLAAIVLTLAIELASIKRLQASHEVWDRHSEQATAIGSALYRLRASTGYGGFIHDFKNLVLRRDLPRYRAAIESDIAAVTASLDRLDGLLTEPPEQAALRQLRATFGEYAANFLLVTTMVAEGRNSDEIDALAKVADPAALAALDYLGARVDERAREAEAQARAIQRDAMRFLQLGAALVIGALVAATWAASSFLRRVVQANAAARRSKAEAARSAELLRGSIEALDDAFALFDPDDRLVLCNQRYRELTPLSADQMVPGTRFEQIVRAGAERGEYANAASRVDAWLAERMAVHRQPAATFQHLLGDGRTLRVVERRMPDGHRVVSRIDITDLVRATEAAQQASRAKSQFLANMSHEIRTPMNAVIGLAHLLEHTRLDADQQALVAKVHIAGRSLLGVINDVLDFSKIEAGEMELLERPFDLHDLVDEAASVAGVQAGARGLALTVRIVPGLPQWLHGDVERLRQILTNLLGNAVKFTETGGVGVAVDRLHDAETDVTLRITVSDTGVGIAPEQVEQLFEPFVQVDMGNARRWGGTGLGLSIVKRLATLMGGEVGVRSRLGEGSEFWVRLPFALAQVPPGTSAALDVLAATEDAAERVRLEAAVASLGWRGEAVAGGERLLDRARERLRLGPPLDALLIDAPPSGLLRELDALQVPTIVMVAPGDRPAWLAAPGLQPHDGLLNKPVTASALFHAVHAARTRGGRAAGHPAAAAGTASRLAGIRVLVADDSDINREVARRILEREGARVTLAADGLQALTLLRAAPSGFDAVLMDVQMPNLDGHEATRAIRGELGLAALPVFALTAGALAGERQKALDAGMDDFITKPIDPSALVVLLARRLVPGAPSPSIGPGTRDPPPEWPDVDGIDRASVCERLGGDVALFGRMLRSLLRDAADLETAGPAPRSAAERTGLAARMHRLRGAAGMLAARQLQGCAAEVEAGLEAPGDEGAAADTSIDRPLGALAAELGRLRSSAGPLLARLEAAEVERLERQAHESPDPAALAQLATRLAERDFAALDSFAALAPGLRGSLGGPRFAALAEAMEALDFGAALALLAPPTPD